MGDFNKQICRLCLVISSTRECETIEEIKKEILQVLHINIDFDISSYAVACNRCLKRLQDCFNFKSHIITTHMDEINKTSQKEMIGESLCLEKLQLCRLCMSLIKKEAFNYTADLKGSILLKRMIGDCFPEVDLSTHVHDPLICKQCVSSLERYYEFMKNCQKVEQKIVRFCQVAGHCTPDKVNLENMLKFKHYDIPSIPLIIKKECLGAENVDENATKCPEGEEIASIKCEEIDIKNELANGAEQSGSYQLHDYDNIGEEGFSKGKRKVGRYEPEEKHYFCPKCPYSTERFCNFKMHIHTHPDNEQHYCTLCSFVTDTGLLLHAHMTGHKGATEKYGSREWSYETDNKCDELKRKDISEVEMHKCHLCPFQFKSKSNLVNHLKLQHNIERYKCQECSFSTKSNGAFESHMTFHLMNKSRHLQNTSGHLQSKRRRRKQLQVKRRILTDASDPLTIPDDTFEGLYRLSKETANYVLTTVAHLLNDASTEEISIPKTLKIMITLRFFAQGNYQEICGQDSDCPTSELPQTVISNCIREVTAIINNEMAHLIHFPLTPEEKNAEKMAFNALPLGFPGIIGAIDGTHVAIIAPPTMGEQYPGILYLNRKGFYSINVQIICNAHLKILAINAQHPGSVHGSAIWTTSPIRQHLEENFNEGDQTSWLLGDSVYPLQPWLMTPLLGANLNRQEMGYNNAHRHIRNVTERLNRVLKSRFRCLLPLKPLYYDPLMAEKIINACAILHNLCIDQDDIFDDNVDPTLNQVIQENVNNTAQENCGNVARQIRTQIINDYF